MSEATGKNEGGFNPGELERIYSGQPVLVNGVAPELVLGARQFETLSLVVRGLQDRRISEEMGIVVSTVRTNVREGYKRLGISARPQLAAYFPFDPDDELVKGKKFADLGKSSGRLEILQALSAGMRIPEAAAHLSISPEAVYSSIYQTGMIWPDTKAMVTLTGVANAIRTRYVQSIDYEDIGELTLPALKEVEPVILDRIEEQAH